MGVAQVAEELLELVLVGVRVAVQAEEVEGRRGGGIFLGGGGKVVVDGGAVGVLIGVQEDVGAVVFVITELVLAWCELEGNRVSFCDGFAYSRAHRYGSRARMLGRAHVSRLKAGITNVLSRIPQASISVCGCLLACALCDVQFNRGE